jgi:4-amino-4-deoxy-L-arabinose transferase-like glycosyltransferase
VETPVSRETQAAIRWRIELATIVSAMIAGSLARLGGCFAVLQGGIGGLDHFDEGIYVSAALSWAADGRPPGMLPPYAPPIYPGLVALASREFGPPEFWAVFISWVASAATIFVAGLLGRRWFGPGAGATAAIFAAASGHQAAHAMMALTDATFLLAWMAGLGAVAAWLAKPTMGRAVILGLAAGLAQDVKYSGWLLLAVATIAVGLRWIAMRTAVRRPSMAESIGGLAVASVVAALIYTPWFLFVERHGGYAGLLRHHSSYVQGWSAWGRNFSAQLAQAQALEQSWSPWGCLAAGIAFIVLSMPATKEGRVRAALQACGLLALFGLGKRFLPGLSWGFGAILILQAVRADGSRGSRVLAASWALLTLMTPLYHPYTRLWLPMTAIEWFAVASALQLIGEGKGGEIRRSLGVILLAALISCGLRTWNGSSPIEMTATARPVGRSEGGIGKPVIAALSRIGPQAKASVIAVLGRPTLLMALAEAGFPVERLPDIEVLTGQAAASFAIADSLVIGAAGGEGGAQPEFAGWLTVERLEIPIATVTAFDQDPGIANDASRPAVSYFWILRRASP